MQKILAAMATLTCLAWLIADQVVERSTRVAPEQLAAIVAVEWAKCQAKGTNPDGSTWDCTGVEMYRIRYADGTSKVFLAEPAPPGFVVDAKWVRQPLKP